MNPSFYDDNFGNWHDTDDADTLDFYNEVQKRSVYKQCRQCDRRVKILPDYSLCNDCAEANERGYQF